MQADNAKGANKFMKGDIPENEILTKEKAAEAKSAQKAAKSKTAFSVARANEYVEKNASAVGKKYAPSYHVVPPVGWMNDPNGFCYALNKYRLFFQFHPYSVVWGPMHWGHYDTDDFVKWERKSVAIAPDKDYDADGCFSGSSIEKDGKQFLFYTAVKGNVQEQAAAVSSDGENFVKTGVIISGEKLPEDCSRADFRDPYVFLKDGTYCMLCGSQAKDKDAQVLLFCSKDLQNWEFKAVLRKDSKPSFGIYECPCMFSFGDKDVLVTSPQGYVADGWRFENACSSIYTVGKLDLKNGKFEKYGEDEIDGGFNFYAAQTLVSPDGRIIMIAWIHPWCIQTPGNEGIKGAMILPRELRLENGALYQSPVREIEKYRKNGVRTENVSVGENTVINGVSGKKIEIICDFSLENAESAGVEFFKGENTRASICVKKDGTVIFDRSETGVDYMRDANETNALKRTVKVAVNGGKVRLRIFLDVSVCEIFVNDGERVMTGYVYTRENGDGVSFFARGGKAELVSLEKYDIETGNQAINSRFAVTAKVR